MGTADGQPPDRSQTQFYSAQELCLNRRSYRILTVRTLLPTPVHRAKVIMVKPGARQEGLCIWAGSGHTGWHGLLGWVQIAWGVTEQLQAAPFRQVCMCVGVLTNLGGPLDQY